VKIYVKGSVQKLSLVTVTVIMDLARNTAEDVKSTYFMMARIVPCRGLALRHSPIGGKAKDGLRRWKEGKSNQVIYSVT
jgi:hypothetical protein